MSDSDRRITTAELHFACPDKAKLWGIQRQQDGGGWKRAHAPKVDGSAPGPGKCLFELSDLGIETIETWWGGGTYRVLWMSQPGRPRIGQTPPFDVVLSRAPRGAEPPAPPRNGASQTPEQAPPAEDSLGTRAPPVALTQHDARHRLATSQGAPPLEQIDPARWIAARDMSPVETFMAMQMAAREQWQMMQQESMRLLADHRESEERRSREWLAQLDLQRVRIEADAQIRIAEHQARAQHDSERAGAVADELSAMRELVNEAMTGARAGESDAVAAALAELRERFDEMNAEDEDGDQGPAMGATAVIISSLIEHLAPIAQQIATAKLQGVAGQLVDGAAGAAG